MIGRTLLHYEILGKLGQGGMGEVWLARDTKLDREVAVKILPADTAADREQLERFQREAKAVAALNHPNIVTIFAVEEADGAPFFTMEYVAGETMSRLIPKEGFDRDRFLDFAITIADAVSAAHDRGITHRDLKPGNIMVSASGQLKVLDFGLAKLSGGGEPLVDGSDSHLETEFLTSEGQVLGTTPYMSPEQLKGRPVDQRSDIFALGTIFYAMATGTHPFKADSSAEVISSILCHHPPEVSEINTELPKVMGGVIRRCLEKAPEDRYQTARELRADLERLRSGSWSDPGPVTEVMTEATRETPRRSGFDLRLGIGMAAAALLLIGAFYVGRPRPVPVAELRTVAVLPFANLTGNPELDSLSEGLSAGLTNRLREEEGIVIVARSEAWSDRDRSPGELAEELGVGSVVDGEILEEGSRLACTVALTDTATGLVLWSHTYSAPGGEVYGLQRVMAGDLATFLSIPITAGDRLRLVRDPQGTGQAFEFYVTGRRFLDSVDDLRGPDAAAENFRQALRLAPDFALAHVGLSEALWEIYLRDLDRQALTDAEGHAERARKLAPEMPEARLALARIFRTTGRHDEALREVEAVLADHPRADEVQRELGRGYERAGALDEAERSLRAATALRPDDWINWNALGNFLARSGDYEEARDAYMRAEEVAPADVSMAREKLATYNLQVGNIDSAIDLYESLPKPIRSPRLASNLATAYFFSDRPERWEKAEENYLLAVRLNPQDSMYQANLGDLYHRLERLEEAQRRYLLACELLELRFADDPDDPALMSELAFTSAKARDCSRALTLASRLEEVMPDTGPNAHQLAYVYALCGESDAAVEALARAIAHGEAPELIRQEDEFRSLRERADYQALVNGDR